MPNLSHIDKKREPASREASRQCTASDSKLLIAVAVLLIASAAAAWVLMAVGG